MQSCIVCGMKGVYIEPRFGYTVCDAHVNTPPAKIGAMKMKQFTEEELQTLLDDEFRKGYHQGVNKGFAHGAQYSNYALKGRVANQRRELRRLNKMLTDISIGALAQRGIERAKQYFGN